MKLEYTPKSAGILKPGLFSAEVVDVKPDGDKHWLLKSKLVTGHTIDRKYPMAIVQDDATHQDMNKLLGREIPDPGAFDLDGLRGAKFIAVINQKKAGKGKPTPNLALILSRDELTTAAAAATKDLAQSKE
jgi:hypothetical protein